MRISVHPHPLPLAAVAVAASAAVVGTATPASAVVSSRLTLGTSASHVRVGTPVTFTGRLSGPIGAIGGQPLTFYDRTASSAWHPVGSARTDSDGVARLTRRLGTTAQWQARWHGNIVVDGSTSPTRTVSVYRPQPPFGERVVREAARHEGAPYEYGAAGPDRFDCSGFTMYVFGRFGIRLPHNAAAQYDAVRHVPASAMRLGDLVFFENSSGIYHVGIYAGNGRMWAATHTGDYVRLEGLSSSYVVGRAG